MGSLESGLGEKSNDGLGQDLGAMTCLTSETSGTCSHPWLGLSIS